MGSTELRLNIVNGVVLAFIVFILHSLFGMVHWWNVFGYLFVGALMSVTLLGSERLWHNIIMSMMKKPLSLWANMTRFPFWYIAGGVGYVLGMLFAKRIGLMGFYDIPVKPLFTFGAKLGMVIQMLWLIVLRTSSKRRLKNMSEQW